MTASSLVRLADSVSIEACSAASATSDSASRVGLGQGAAGLVALADRLGVLALGVVEQRLDLVADAGGVRARRGQDLVGLGTHGVGVGLGTFEDGLGVPRQVAHLGGGRAGDAAPRVRWCGRRAWRP